VFNSSVIASPMLQYRGPMVLGLPDEAWFTVTPHAEGTSRWRSKWAVALSVPLPTTAATNEMLSAARGVGLGDKDFAAVFNLLAQLSGVSAMNTMAPG
jgi:3-hydroxyisobutyrate dehydrogenase-like beta-hydroxyacid dehydrogenase